MPKRFVFFLIFLVVFVIAIVFISRGVNNLQVTSALDKYHSFTPKEIDSDKNLAELNIVLTLPIDQNGSVGIIKDVKSLSDKKSFFKKARNGDLLVIYPDMTVIYDPVNKTVVDIAKTNLLK